MTAEIGGRDRHLFFRRPVVGARNADGTAALPPIQHGVALQTTALEPEFAPRGMAASAGAATGGIGATGLGRLRGPLRPPTKLAPLGGAAASDHVHDGLAAAGGVGTESAAAHAGAGAAGAHSRDMGCQTLYRESECQTDPYTPDYFIEAGQNPELLALAELRWNEGLPAGTAEVELVDRIQRRRRVEAGLPTGNDDASIAERLRQLETLEKTEWAERERHIEGLQAERLGKIDAAMQTREARREDEGRDRVEALKQRRLAEVEVQLQKLQAKRLAATRRVVAKHGNPTQEPQKPNIVAAHATFGPTARQVQSSAIIEPPRGAFGATGGVGATLGAGRAGAINNYDVRPTLLSFPEGVSELERTKVPPLERIPDAAWTPPEDKEISLLPTHYQQRKARTVVDHLEYAQALIDGSRDAKKTQAQSIQELYRATPRLQRPDTPVLALQNDDTEEREEAVLLLQRLLRGRAVQNDFFEGKERCHGLIDELQAAASAQGAERQWLPMQQREQHAQRQREAAQDVVKQAVGDVVFGTLDFLYKELRRQHEVALVDSMRRDAVRVRAAREAEETARRAAEAAARAKADALCGQVAATVDAAAETFLQSVLLGACKRTAEVQSLAEAAAAAQRRAAEAAAAVAAVGTAKSAAAPPSATVVALTADAIAAGLTAADATAAVASSSCAGAVPALAFSATDAATARVQRELYVCGLLDSLIFPVAERMLDGVDRARVERAAAVTEAAVDSCFGSALGVLKV